MNKQRMEHPEGHSDWVSTPAAGGSPHNDDATSPSAPQPTPRGAGDIPGGNTSTHTKGAPGEYMHASPLGGNLEEDPPVNPIDKGTAWTKKRDLRIYNRAMLAYLTLGAVLGWRMWGLSVAGVGGVWDYVLCWSYMAWVAGFGVLYCVWSSARRELKRESALSAEAYAANAGLSGEDSALFTQTIGEVS